MTCLDDSVSQNTFHALVLSTHSLGMFLGPWRDAVDVPFRTELTAVAYSWHFDPFCVLPLTIPHCRQKLLWPRLLIRNFCMPSPTISQYVKTPSHLVYYHGSMCTCEGYPHLHEIYSVPTTQMPFRCSALTQW